MSRRDTCPRTSAAALCQRSRVRPPACRAVAVDTRAMLRRKPAGSAITFKRPLSYYRWIGAATRAGRLTGRRADCRVSADAAGPGIGRMTEQGFLLSLHAAASPSLDAVFLVSHWIGDLWASAALVWGMAAWQ